MGAQQTPECDTCSKYRSEFCANPGSSSCSEWERQYYDQDGNKVSLDKLCRIEPAWAANRLRAELKENRRLTAENARLRKDRDRFECDFVDAKADFGGMMAEANKRVDAAIARAEKAERDADRLGRDNNGLCDKCFDLERETKRLREESDLLTTESTDLRAQIAALTNELDGYTKMATDETRHWKDTSESWRKSFLAWQQWATDLIRELGLKPIEGKLGDRLARDLIAYKIKEQVRLRKWQYDVAVGIGYLNQADGRSEYEVAPAETVVRTWKEMEADVDRLRSELAARRVRWRTGEPPEGVDLVIEHRGRTGPSIHFAMYTGDRTAPCSNIQRGHYYHTSAGHVYKPREVVKWVQRSDLLALIDDPDEGGK